MGSLYGINVYIDKLPTAELVRRTHQVLLSCELHLCEPPEVWVDDDDLDEPVPEFIASGITDAIRFMAQHQCTTALAYQLSARPRDPQSQSTGYVVNAFFVPNLALSLLTLGFVGNVFRRDKFPHTLGQMVSVVDALHHELGGLRSNFHWGLEDVFPEAEEAERLSRGQVLAEPLLWLDVIDDKLVTPELQAIYQDAVKPDSILRRTANGSLFWQRDAGPP